MNPYIQQVNQHLRDYAQQSSGAKAPAVLDLLWESYIGSNPMADTEIRQTLAALEPIHRALSIHDSDKLNDIILDLSYSYERAAFLEGIRIGVCLQTELFPYTQKCTP